jgi:hypothetical protein
MALTGERRAWDFDTLDEQAPVREIIRWRVREEVARQALKQARDIFQASPTERALNGPRPGRAVDWEQEYTRALEAFTAHRYIVLIDDRQVDDLDMLVSLRAGCEVVFLRLTPLVGG